MDKNVENTKPIENRKRFKDFLPIIVIVFSVILLVIEGFVYYQRAYLTPFWVNGQSMYPTLNGNALDAKGNKLNENSGPSAVGYTVDYGVMDKHEKAINKLKRFDVVVTKYDEFDTSDKIKRVIGLPGETIWFTVTGEGNKNNGNLYVNGELIEQPLESKYVIAGSYPSGKIKLKQNQYFVCGDNRAHSYDSRDVGAIPKTEIVGKAVALCATAKVFLNNEGKLDVKDIKYHSPRYL